MSKKYIKPIGQAVLYLKGSYDNYQSAFIHQDAHPQIFEYYKKQLENALKEYYESKSVIDPLNFMAYKWVRIGDSFIEEEGLNT